MLTPLSSRKLRKLVKALGDEEGRALAAAAALASAGGAEAVEALVAAYGRESRPGMLAGIADALASVGGPDAVDALTGLAARLPVRRLHNEIATVALTGLSIEAAAALADQRALERTLVGCVGADNEAATRLAGHAARHPGPLRELLRRVADTDPDLFVRRVAPVVTGGGEARARTLLLAATGGDLDEVRDIAYDEVREGLRAGLEWAARWDWHTRGRAAIRIAAHEEVPDPAVASAIDRYCERIRDQLDRFRPPTGAATAVTVVTEATCCSEHDARFGRPQRPVAPPAAPAVLPDRVFGEYGPPFATGDVETIAAIPTAVAANLLHHIAAWDDTTDTARRSGGEVPYDHSHPSGDIEIVITTQASFGALRGAAREALAARGNPAYDAAAYRVDGWWRIPR